VFLTFYAVYTARDAQRSFVLGRLSAYKRRTFAVTEAEESGWKLIHGDVFRCLCHVSSSSTMFPHQALIKNLDLFPFFHTPDIQTTRRFFVRFWATEHSSCVCALEYSSWHASACTGAFFHRPQQIHHTPDCVRLAATTTEELCSSLHC
jgi:hypothetical protein